MISYIGVNYTGIAALCAPGWDIDQRRIKTHRALANRRGMVHWREKYLPKRFQTGNQRYNHQRRKEPYSNIKKIIGQGGVAYVKGKRIDDRVERGGVVDIVRSGISENKARGAAGIRSFSTKATTRIAVKSVVAARPQAGKPDMRHEITFTPASEREGVRRVISKSLIMSLKSDRSHLSKKLWQRG